MIKNSFEQKFKDTYNLEYEPDRLDYTIVHKYTPDWKLTENTYFETKGRWISSDRSKIRAVLKQNPSVQIVMIFQNPKLKLSKSSKTTYSDFCDKHAIPWFDYKDTRGIKDFINRYK